MTMRIGMLTPSSNTALEPATYRLLRGLPSVSAHFARFPVTEIALSADALAQFAPAPILEAARLLSHAKVDTIAWNGTSASWLGIDRDEALAQAITAQTGIPATTAILALHTLIRRMTIRRLAIVTPYTGDVQARIIANFEAAGVACVAERHAGLSDNFAFATLPPAEIEAMILAGSAARPDAIAVICTNMDASTLAPAMEARLGVPVLDSIAFTLWGALDRLAIPKTPLHDAGMMFRY
jgi:maleate isomerase